MNSCIIHLLPNLSFVHVYIYTMYMSFRNKLSEKNIVKNIKVIIFSEDIFLFNKKKSAQIYSLVKNKLELN